MLKQTIHITIVKFKIAFQKIVDATIAAQAFNFKQG